MWEKVGSSGMAFAWGGTGLKALDRLRGWGGGGEKRDGAERGAAGTGAMQKESAARGNMFHSCRALASKRSTGVLAQALGVVVNDSFCRRHLAGAIFVVVFVGIMAFSSWFCLLYNGEVLPVFGSTSNAEIDLALEPPTPPRAPLPPPLPAPVRFEGKHMKYTKYEY